MCHFHHKDNLIVKDNGSTWPAVGAKSQRCVRKPNSMEIGPVDAKRLIQIHGPEDTAFNCYDSPAQDSVQSVTAKCRNNKLLIQIEFSVSS